MKIILEFKSRFEHDRYCCEVVEKIEKPEIIIGGEPIDDTTKRKHWSDSEIQFLRDNYETKKVRWIAKQLRRKSTAVYQKLTKLYEAGLPKKRNNNGEIQES